MLKSEEMSDTVALSVTVNTSRTQENGICLGRVNVLQGLYHHTQHGTFITTPSIAPLSPHWPWHLYHHTDHGTFITTRSMAGFSYTKAAYAGTLCKSYSAVQVSNKTNTQHILKNYV